jgi:hypothetical protein
MSSEYDKFVDDLLLEEKTGRTQKPQTHEKEMSSNQKDQVKGQSVVSIEGSKSVDEYQRIKHQIARFRHQNHLQKYKMDEIKLDGDKLIVDEEKYQKRIEEEKKLMIIHEKTERESRGSIPFTTDGLPDFDKKRGFKAYNKEKWTKEGKLIV